MSLLFHLFTHIASFCFSDFFFIFFLIKGLLFPATPVFPDWWPPPCCCSDSPRTRSVKSSWHVCAAPVVKRVSVAKSEERFQTLASCWFVLSFIGSSTINRGISLAWSLFSEGPGEESSRALIAPLFEFYNSEKFLRTSPRPNVRTMLWILTGGCRLMLRSLLVISSTHVVC